MTSSRFYPDAGLTSWGRVLRPIHQAGRPAHLGELPEFLAQAARLEKGVLGIGLGRSYGDSGLNPDGGVIVTTALDRLIAFDPATGLVRAEAGISLLKLLEFLIRRGYFLPVTPGTRFVTLGGAIANDVHGKNHQVAGTFGRWMRGLGLLRGDGALHDLRPGEKLFEATIGGLGLTGLIAWAEFQAIPIKSRMMEAETISFSKLDEFFEISTQSEAGFPYGVAWIDCMAAQGRGLFSRARHAQTGGLQAKRFAPRLSLPMPAPGFLLNRLTITAFNDLYFRRGAKQTGLRLSDFGSFFYPLDAIGHANLLYGKKGFYQYQSVVPPGSARAATAEMLRQISSAGQGSFLAVLKNFGGIGSPGMLSFPQEGTSLALDFPNLGQVTLSLLSRLDDIVREAGGRLYPAKDGRMSAAMFRAGYPRLAEFAAYRDPVFASAFSRRMEL
jgi:FAD/FMN-containing dehydrogenase